MFPRANPPTPLELLSLRLAARACEPWLTRRPLRAQVGVSSEDGIVAVIETRRMALGYNGLRLGGFLLLDWETEARMMAHDEERSRMIDDQADALKDMLDHARG
jgi:hypothetical protein